MLLKPQSTFTVISTTTFRPNFVIDTHRQARAPMIRITSLISTSSIGKHHSETVLTTLDRLKKGSAGMKTPSSTYPDCPFLTQLWRSTNGQWESKRLTGVTANPVSLWTQARRSQLKPFGKRSRLVQLRCNGISRIYRHTLVTLKLTTIRCSSTTTQEDTPDLKTMQERSRSLLSLNTGLKTWLVESRSERNRCRCTRER